MLANQQVLAAIVRLAAPWVWRSDERTANKLFGFAATEAGSALDMLKAAEMVTDPKLRRLFFRHAIDEARHAEMFRAHARALAPAAKLENSEYAQVRARRQNLLQSLGLTRFVAFVHLAEKRGHAHFESLRRHFAGHPQLEALFRDIANDERFHVAYSGGILKRWANAGAPARVSRAMRSVKLQGMWQAWRRAGRRIGDVMSGVVLGVVYLAVLPIFAVAQRIQDRKRPGWKSLPSGKATAIDLRSQS